MLTARPTRYLPRMERKDLPTFISTRREGRNLLRASQAGAEEEKTLEPRLPVRPSEDQRVIQLRAEGFRPLLERGGRVLHANRGGGRVVWKKIRTGGHSPQGATAEDASS